VSPLWFYLVFFVVNLFSFITLPPAMREFHRLPRLWHGAAAAQHPIGSSTAPSPAAAPKRKELARPQWPNLYTPNIRTLRDEGLGKLNIDADRLSDSCVQELTLSGGSWGKEPILRLSHDEGCADPGRGWTKEASPATSEVPRQPRSRGSIGISKGWAKVRAATGVGLWQASM